MRRISAIQGRKGALTHESFGAKASAIADESAKVSDPGHGRCRRDLPRDGIMTPLTITGAAVHLSPPPSLPLRARKKFSGPPDRDETRNGGTGS